MKRKQKLERVATPPRAGYDGWTDKPNPEPYRAKKGIQTHCGWLGDEESAASEISSAASRVGEKYAGNRLLPHVLMVAVYGTKGQRHPLQPIEGL